MILTVGVNVFRISFDFSSQFMEICMCEPQAIVHFNCNISGIIIWLFYWNIFTKPDLYLRWDRNEDNRFQKFYRTEELGLVEDKTWAHFLVQGPRSTARYQISRRAAICVQTIHLWAFGELRHTLAWNPLHVFPVLQHCVIRYKFYLQYSSLWSLLYHVGERCLTISLSCWRRKVFGTS